VGEPAVELPLGELLQDVDQQVIGVMLARPPTTSAPQLGRLDDRPHDRLVAVFKQRVELGDRPLTYGIVGLELLRELEQRAGFLDQPQLRQPTQQVVQ
jgi:hypothetical protein